MKCLLCLALLPLFAFSQQTADTTRDVTGLWKGYFSTSQKRIPYEVIITRQGGKLSGYSYTTFTVKDREIVSMKKMNIYWLENKLMVEDDDNLYNNFPTDEPSKIKQINTVSLNDKIIPQQLTGTFETKVPRQLKKAKGEVFLQKKEDEKDVKILAKITELNLDNTISFTLNKDISTVAVIPSTPVVAEPGTNYLIALPGYSTRNVQPISLSVRNAGKTITRFPAYIAAHRPRHIPIAIETKTTVTETTVAAVKNPAVKPSLNPVKTNNKPVVVNTVKPPIAVVTAKAPVNTPDVSAPVKPVNVAVAPVIDLAKRTIETIDEFMISGDSLQLTLFDNGEVDGDTVSIIMNGKTIVFRQGLSTSAFTKTIYITPDLGDTIQLVMYAETLGSIPPNTGLLILNYDRQRKEVRFSGDLTKNAAITLKVSKKVLID